MEVELEEGCFVDFLQGGEKLRGKVVRKNKDLPFDEKNFWVRVGVSCYYQPSIEDIVYVYPRIIFPYNPSRRS